MHGYGEKLRGYFSYRRRRGAAQQRDGAGDGRGGIQQGNPLPPPLIYRALFPVLASSVDDIGANQADGHRNSDGHDSSLAPENERRGEGDHRLHGYGEKLRGNFSHRRWRGAAQQCDSERLVRGAWLAKD